MRETHPAVHFVATKMSKPSEKSVRAEEARFRARLRRVLLVGLAAGPAAAAGACSTSGGGDGVGAMVDASGSVDATTNGPEASLHDAGAADAADPCGPVRLDPATFGNDGACDDYVRLPCGIPPDAARALCVPSADLCTAMCPSKVFLECAYSPVTCVDGSLLPDAEAVIECGLCVGNLGRRPSALPEDEARVGPGVGDYFARAAYLEAASVDAFVELESRLATLGAPRSLRARAARAAADEKRHARTTSRIARGHGVEPQSPWVASAESPSTQVTLEELARANVVEGCVRESFAALVAMHQAARAEDPRVARAMGVIARDEARHAALSWSIHAWATRRLDSRARARVRAAAAGAIAKLHVDARSPRGGEIVRLAGHPSAAREAALALAFSRAFFVTPRTQRPA